MIRGGIRSWLGEAGILCAAMAALTALSACSTVGLKPQSPLASTAVPTVGPGRLLPSEIQSELMSFNDTFANVVAQEWNRVASGELRPEPEEEPSPAARDQIRRAALELKIANVSGALSIASSPNPVVAVADMITMITLQRSSLEEPWAADLFGQAAAAHVVDTYSDEEEKLWVIGRKVFTEPQQTELMDVIAQWQREHPEQRYVAGVRLGAYARERQQAVQSRAGGGGSLLSILMLDPLADLDPATREIQQSRMLAERIFFYASHMPQILKWQAQSLSESLLGAQQVQQTVAAIDRISEAADRLSTVAEQLPRERRAALDQLFSGLTEQREELFNALESDRLGETLEDFRDTIQASRELAGSLSAAIQSARELVREFGPPGAAAPENAPGPDFFVQYGAAARQTTVAADRLTGLADQLNDLLGSQGWDRVAGSAQAVTAEVRSSGERLVDHVFWRLLTLVVVAPFAVVGALAAYHWIRRRELDARRLE